MIEPTNICNLRCPLCASSTLKRARGYMTFDMFQKIMGNINGKIDLLNFTLAGEPLLNKDIFKMIRYAKEERNVKNIIMLTNGTFFDKFSYDDLLESGITSYCISLDGTTERTYVKYRVGGDFKRVINNIKNLCLEKKRRKEKFPNKKYPEIMISFLVSKYNEHEIDKIKKLSKELMVDKLLLKTIALWTEINKEDRKKIAKSWLPLNKKFWRYDDNLALTSPIKKCAFMFDMGLILWNGDVSLCCMDMEGKIIFGNLLKQKFRDIYLSEKFNNTRNLFLKKKLNFCKNCNIPDEGNVGEFELFS